MMTEVCNIAKVCKVCGAELNFQTARETKKGSGSLRSACLDCERKKDRARHEDVYVKKNTKKISRGPMFAERPNRVGMACQDSEVIPIYNKKYKNITVFHDMRCDECNSVVRYDKHLERVCSVCGLVSGGPVIFDEPNSEFARRQLTAKNKSRYRLRLYVNRDGAFDIQSAESGHVVQDRYEPTISDGTFDPAYSKYYKKKLGTSKNMKYKNRIEKIGKMNKDESFSRKNHWDYI